MKKLITLLFSISLFLCFSFITTDSVFLGTQTDGLNIGEKAPGFTIESPDGKEFSLNDYKGKVVLLDFWASWCKPCRRDNPNVVKMYHEYKDKGFDIFSVSLDR
jgi:thiol-disulfide isomerase/thioredoxin